MLVAVRGEELFDVQHGLQVVHADGPRAFKLARINAHNAAAHGFRHIGAGVDGNDDDTHRPDVLERHAEEVRHGSAENFHIDPDDDPDNLQQDPLNNIVLWTAGNRLEDSADEPDDTADQRCDHSQDQRVKNPRQIHGMVFRPKTCNIGKQLCKHMILHKPHLPPESFTGGKCTDLCRKAIQQPIIR